LIPLSHHAVAITGDFIGPVVETVREVVATGTRNPALALLDQLRRRDIVANGGVQLRDHVIDNDVIIEKAGAKYRCSSSALPRDGDGSR
jgi:hypothetical protein